MTVHFKLWDTVLCMHVGQILHEYPNLVSMQTVCCGHVDIKPLCDH